MTKIKKLTQKQELFCQEFAKTGRGADSYRVAYNPTANNTVAGAGYNRLVNNPRVKARLAELNRKVENDNIASIQEIKERLTEILRQSAEEEVLMTEGVEKGVTQTVRYKKTADLRTAAKAAELLAKMAGAFSDGNQTMVGVQVVIKDDLEE